MSNGCQELLNIKYQTMLLNNNTNKSGVFENKDNVKSMDNFLEKEKIDNAKNPWSKLSITMKMKKLYEYAETYSKTEKDIDKKKLKDFLKNCVERKKLQRVKDVDYDIETQKIKSIVGLTFIKSKNKFTLKNKGSKISSLKNLAPKKSKDKTRKKLLKKEKLQRKEKAKLKSKVRHKKSETSSEVLKNSPKNKVINKKL